MYLSVSLLYYSLKFGILHIQCHFHYIYVHTSYTSRDFIFSYCCANDFQLQIFSSVSFSFHRFALLCFPYSSSSLLWKEIVMIHKTRNFYLYTFHILYYNLIYVCALKNYDSAFWYDNTANGKSEERKQASKREKKYDIFLSVGDDIKCVDGGSILLLVLIQEEPYFIIFFFSRFFSPSFVHGTRTHSI